MSANYPFVIVSKGSQCRFQNFIVRRDIKEGDDGGDVRQPEDH